MLGTVPTVWHVMCELWRVYLPIRVVLDIVMLAVFRLLCLCCFLHGALVLSSCYNVNKTICQADMALGRPPGQAARGRDRVHCRAPGFWTANPKSCRVYSRLAELLVIDLHHICYGIFSHLLHFCWIMKNTSTICFWTDSGQSKKTSAHSMTCQTLSVRLCLKNGEPRLI